MRFTFCLPLFWICARISWLSSTLFSYILLQSSSSSSIIAVWASPDILTFIGVKSFTSRGGATRSRTFLTLIDFLFGFSGFSGFSFFFGLYAFDSSLSEKRWKSLSRWLISLWSCESSWPSLGMSLMSKYLALRSWLRFLFSGHFSIWLDGSSKLEIFTSGDVDFYLFILLRFYT